LIQIYSSASLQLLAEKCAEKLTDSGLEDPFTPHTILVPNLDCARWLRLRICELNGILANIEFMLPAEWQWKQVRKIHSNLPKTLASDRIPMKWSLYQILSDEKMNRKFPILYRYIASQNETSMDHAVYQLSGKLASLFDEYLIYRPEMMNLLENGYAGKGDEKWQAELWRMLTVLWKSSSGFNTPQNRALLFTKTENALQKGDITSEPSIMAFNTGLMPAIIMRSLQHCGDQSDVCFFISEPTNAVQNPGNRIMKSYGEDAKNIAGLYGSVDGYRERLSSNSSSTETLLSAIQQSVIKDEKIPAFGRDDHSVHIRSCHSPLREIEVLHDFLLEQFELDHTLAPDDIAVVTPSPDKYKPYIDAVFNHKEDHLPVIPYHLGSDRKNGGIKKAVVRLLGVLDSRFSFDAVMDLFQSEPVRARFGVSESQSAKVRQWMKDNHVVWGFDKNQRREWNQPAQTHQTWKSALDRGWLGQWIGDNEDQDTLYYHHIESGDEQEVWARFSMFINKLNEAAQSARHKKTLGEWVEWLRELQYAFLLKKENQGEKNEPLQRLFDTLNEIVLAGSESAEISFRVFKTELEQLIDEAGASGAIFTRGVTFSSMVPLRSIPFKVIALIGLNDQEFPRKPVSPEFDLMAKNPQPGERNRKLEDRNLFLESLMAAERVHYCSFVGQSPEDNETIPPSTIVSEWTGFLSECTGKSVEQIVKKEALTGFSPSSYQKLASYSDRYLRTLRKINMEHAVSGLISGSPVQPGENENLVGTDDLTRFFKNPIQYFIHARFGGILREEDSEKGEFSLDHLEMHLIMLKVFDWVLAGEKKEIIQKRLTLSGVLPDGWPGEKLIEDMVNACEISINLMHKHGITPSIYHREIDILSDEFELTGNLMSYSAERLVDVHLSKAAGRNLVQSWIRHILWCVAAGKQESYVICDVKKGDPSLFRFKTPESPEKLLADLMEIYKQGLSEPIPFFPDTLYEFVTTKNEEKKLEKASEKFEGGFYRGEREHLAIKIVMGSDAPFDETFLEPEFKRVFQEMMNHTEEVK
jgi:exodeoxyribonuclease V gamma subunit